jgi:hypothetical protein
LASRAWIFGARASALAQVAAVGAAREAPAVPAATPSAPSANEADTALIAINLPLMLLSCARIPIPAL